MLIATRFKHLPEKQQTCADTCFFQSPQALISWLSVNYIVFTERVRALQHLYNIIAVLVLDGFMVILWLATWAAVAAKRAKFVHDVEVSGCYDNGELIDSKTCYKKRELLKRSVVLFKRGQDQMAAIAGLGALIWYVFMSLIR